MLISLNWLKKYVDIKIPDDELVRLIGARLVEVEGVTDESTKYNSIFVVRVETAEKIPETHLTLCQINNGGDELVQVVCGAPNVREGMLAAWIAPGAIVPASVHEDAPFVIGKRKMLGKYESNGMLAGADELDFGDDHSGIVEIDPEMAKPGDALADIFDLNDKILEIENKSLTHRPDCFGLIGFAREVAGILGQKFEFDSNTSNSGSQPSGPSPRADGANSRAAALRVSPSLDVSESNQIQISIQSSDICSRYSAVILKKHGEIKKKYLTWQDTILSKSGMRPVDPIVDATNYLMLLTGQPLHAFDYDKFVAVGGGSEPKIGVRLAKSGEKLMLLDDKEVELNENDIVITSNDKPVALAGAMGGKDTAIDDDTKNIIIESATFSLYNLRKTQMAHGIFSEAITRFTKGQPAYQTLAVAEECAEMLSDGFEIANIADEQPVETKDIIVKITTSEINGLLGAEYGDDLIKTTLENVGFEISGKSEIEVKAPLWRTDIHIKEDIIEEVGRLLGYDNINPTLPLHGTAGKNSMFALKSKIRGIMERFGANETLTYSFISEKLLEKAGLDVSNSYKIVNSISPELQQVRQSIVPSLLDKAFVNQKIPFDSFAIYEMNKVYQKVWGMNEEGVPVEAVRMGFVLAERKNKETAYYKAKFYVEQLFAELNIEPTFRVLNSDVAEAKPFEKKRAAEIYVGDELVGFVGEFKQSVKNNFKLADYLAGFELDLEKILEFAKPTKDVEILLNKESRDLTVVTDETYGELIGKIEEILAKNEVEAEISPVSIYQPEGDKKHISVHLEFREAPSDELMSQLESL